MARGVLKDMCRSITTSTGTGALTLAGAFTGFRSLESVLSNGDTFYYTIFAVDAVGNPTGSWETGCGTYTTSGTSFTRDKITASSNSDSVVSFAAGTKHVIISETQDILRAPIRQPGCRLSVSNSLTSYGSSTGTGTIYLMPFISNFIPLYNGFCWVTRSVPDAGTSLTTTGTVFTSQTCTQTNGSPVLTGLSSTTGMYPGMPTSAGVTGGSVIKSVDSGTQVTLTGNCTANLNTTVSFYHANYDVFAYDNAGTVTLEYLAWTNNTTRATALAVQDGFFVKNGDATRLYVGTFRMTKVAGQTADSAAQRYLWNMFNRTPRTLLKTEHSATASWTHGSAAWRAMNNDYRNQVEFVIGIDYEPVHVLLYTVAQSAAGNTGGAGIGLDSATSPAANSYTGNAGGGGYAYWTNVLSEYRDQPGVGYHYLCALEYGYTTPITFYGDDNGLRGTIWC